MPRGATHCALPWSCSACLRLLRCQLETLTHLTDKCSDTRTSTASVAAQQAAVEVHIAAMEAEAEDLVRSNAQLRDETAAVSRNAGDSSLLVCGCRSASVRKCAPCPCCHAAE